MVSIHASKGDGREVVFVIGVTESGLNIYSNKNTLRYDSMLHVALTRMKKTLYIVHTDDSIGKSIQSWLNKTGQSFEVTKVGIKSTIKAKDLLSLCEEKLNALIDLDFQESSCTSQIIDMSHHNIRFGILIEKIRELLEEEEGRQQIKTQKEISCRVPIQTWYTWKEYNFRVKLNAGFKGTNQQRQQEFSIPLLKINEGVYNHYLGIIKQHMERVRINVRNARKLCPFELIVMYYMNQITQKNYKSRITVMELYNIVDVYERAFKYHLKGHDHCCCKETFLDNDNKNSFTDYLNSHYEQMSRVDRLLQKLVNVYHMDWNADHPIKYIDCPLDSRFTIKSSCDFIGYNATHVLLCYVTPKLTSLNINVFKTCAMLDTFLVKNQCESDQLNYQKYHGKQVAVCVLAINLDDPYMMNLDVEETLVKEAISTSMYEYYSLQNKEVYHFYQTLRKKYESKDLIQKMFTNWNTFKSETKSFVPNYVDGFMDDLNRQSRRKEASTFVTELDVSFMDRLNEELKYSIREFLKL